MASYKVVEPDKNGKPRIKITVELGYNEETGRRIRKYKTVTLNSLSERTIKKAITEFEIEAASSDITKTLDTIKFKDFVERWLDNYVRVDLSPKTKNNYIRDLNLGILDELGEYQLAKIKTFHIVECLNKWKVKKDSTARTKYVVLKSIFSKAIEWRVIDENPMQGVKAPYYEPKQKELAFYDEEQLKQLFEVLKQVNPKNRIRIKLAALAGLRLSEIAGIRLECIDFKNNVILIDKTLQLDDETKKLILGPTKNKKPRRVNVPSSFMNELKDYVNQQRKLQIKSGNLWTPMLDENGTPINFLFTKNNGYPMQPRTLYTEWRRITKTFNLPWITFHNLRHSYASYMVSKDVNFKIIQEQLGHSDIKMTLNTYSHLTEKDKKMASDLFDEIL